ncbi:hypothetical protein [Rhizobium sp. BK176]|jgi:arylsulfatase A-like enzyme|uniref:hypothetical protein n=1 Tax=Rhizobium sp. BK176 TaxID=2587071 RepID=UPI00216A550E|nr:hypothetical protein [Rhizobium sp. BK176]MCS4092393.1 arylsulfatase A-like enzyme [Rhizobium sp. BK176]
MVGAVRDGDWKLVRKASLPPSVELFDLSKDKSETTNLADGNADLQGRVTALAAE